MAGRKTTRSMQNKTSTKTDRSIRSDFALTARYWQATTSFTSIEFENESRDPENICVHRNELPRHYTKQRELRNTSKDYPNSPLRGSIFSGIIKGNVLRKSDPENLLQESNVALHK